MRFCFGMTLPGAISGPIAAGVVSDRLVRDGIPVSAIDAGWHRNTPAALGNLVPFVPQGTTVPLFFLHIPRSSGHSLIAFLRQNLGDTAVTEGAETILPDILTGRRSPVVTDCLTGAVPLMRWERYRQADLFRRITVLRDPWARLVSHINRLALLADAAGPDGSAVQRLAVELAAADYSSRSGLERLKRVIRPVEGGIDNVQTRMLLTGSMSALVKPLNRRDVQVALGNLSKFALVGFCEDQIGLQRGLLRLIGGAGSPVSLFEQGGKAVVLSPRNDLAREVLEPWFAHDQELYLGAKALQGATKPQLQGEGQASLR